MSVVPIRGRDPAAEARALLNCVLREGDIVGTDDAGRTALLLLVNPWTLDRLLAFDAEATDLEDTDGEAEPDLEIDGPATVFDIVPPKRSCRPSRVAQALALALLLVTVPYATARPDQATAHHGAALDRGSASAVLPDLPQGATVRRQLYQRDQAVQERARLRMPGRQRLVTSGSG